MNYRTISRPLVPLACIALCASLTFAQQPAPAPAAPGSAPSAAPIERQAPPPGMRQGMMRPGMRPGMMQQGRSGPGNFRGAQMMHSHGGFHGEQGGFRGGEQGGFHIGPGGMWWKNPMVVQRLTLTPDQVKRMDSIFQESRIQLIDLHANVQKAEVMLEPLLSANPLDMARAQAQIDKVADARADLEKANAKMLLGIRAVLTPDQWTKLHTRGQAAAAAQPGAQGGPTPGQGRTRGMRPPSGGNLVQPNPEQ
jgi:Spy/CpxP family protein refolding chaperone